MPRALPHRLPLVVLTLCLAVITVACGGSSSGGSGDSSATSVEETTTTTIPTPAEVGVTCQRARSSLNRIGDSLIDQGESVDIEALNIRLTAAVDLFRECESKMRGIIPTLPETVQGPATAYADAIGPVLADLANPPGPESALAWLDALTSSSDLLYTAGKNLAKTDPSFGF